MLKSFLEWLMLETGGLFCRWGWHSWERGMTHFMRRPPEKSINGRAPLPVLVTEQSCRWCGAVGLDVWATHFEQQRFLDDRWHAEWTDPARRANLTKIQDMYERAVRRTDPFYSTEAPPAEVPRKPNAAIPVAHTFKPLRRATPEAVERGMGLLGPQFQGNPPLAVRKPSGRSRSKALGKELRKRVDTMLECESGAVVARKVMEEGVGRTVPLSPRPWSVDGLGPMRPAGFREKVPADA